MYMGDSSQLPIVAGSNELATYSWAGGSNDLVTYNWGSSVSYLHISGVAPLGSWHFSLSRLRQGT